MDHGQRRVGLARLDAAQLMQVRNKPQCSAGSSWLSPCARRSSLIRRPRSGSLSNTEGCSQRSRQAC
jgi:hypothetical protein